jgi:hypothetical protein
LQSDLMKTRSNNASTAPNESLVKHAASSPRTRGLKRAYRLPVSRPPYRAVLAPLLRHDPININYGTDRKSTWPKAKPSWRGSAPVRTKRTSVEWCTKSYANPSVWAQSVRASVVRGSPGRFGNSGKASARLQLATAGAGPEVPRSCTIKPLPTRGQ